MSDFMFIDIISTGAGLIFEIDKSQGLGTRLKNENFLLLLR